VAPRCGARTTSVMRKYMCVTQPDVTLTDYALTIECATFSVLASRWPTTRLALQRACALLFAMVALTSLIGGTVHGFFVDDSTRANAVLWTATLFAVGLTSVAMWTTGAHMLLDVPRARVVGRAALALLPIYVLIVLFVSSSFLVGIATYLPATVFLLVAFALTYRRTHNRALTLGIAGLALTFVAAAVQQLHVAIHPVYFNHNALYHVIQGAALFLVFLGSRAAVQGRRTIAAPASL